MEAGRPPTEMEEEEMDVGFPLTGLDYVLQAGATRYVFVAGSQVLRKCVFCWVQNKVL